eukprot:gene6152-7377_t
MSSALRDEVDGVAGCRQKPAMMLRVDRGGAGVTRGQWTALRAGLGTNTELDAPPTAPLSEPGGGGAMTDRSEVRKKRNSTIYLEMRRRNLVEEFQCATTTTTDSAPTNAAEAQTVGPAHRRAATEEAGAGFGQPAGGSPVVPPLDLARLGAPGEDGKKASDGTRDVWAPRIARTLMNLEKESKPSGGRAQSARKSVEFAPAKKSALPDAARHGKRPMKPPEELKPALEGLALRHKPQPKERPPPTEEHHVLLDQFKHQEGCKICEGLFTHHTLPDGSCVHYYHPPKPVVDELEIKVEGAPEPPSTLQITGIRLPPPPEVLAALIKVSPQAPEPFRPPPEAAPRPPAHALRVPEHDCPDAACCSRHGELQHFHTQFRAYEVLERHVEFRVPGGGQASKKGVWSIDDSIFKPRMRQHLAMTDTKRTYHLMFEQDWKWLNSRKAFVENVISGNEFASLSYTTDIKNTLKGYYHELVDYFSYFQGTEAAYGLDLETFIVCFNELGLVNPEIELATEAKIRDMFHEVKYRSNPEYVKEDPTMIRFEFLEAFVFVCVHTTKAWTRDVCSAMDFVIETVVRPNVADEMRINNNMFRADRLYIQSTEKIFTRHEDFLTSVHSYCSNQHPRMQQKQIRRFIEEIGLVNPVYSFFNLEDAGLLMHRSCLKVINDHDYGENMMSLDFLDFLEFLGRMADLMSLPPSDDILVTGCETGTLKEYFLAVRKKQITPIARRRSADILKLATRSLAQKLAPIIHLMIHSFCSRFQLDPDMPNLEAQLVIELKSAKVSGMSFS